MYCNSPANHEYTGTHRIPGSAFNAIKLISQCPYRLLKEQAGNAMVTVNYPGQQLKQHSASVAEHLQQLP